MNDIAAIKATFSDFKIIRSRKVAQYIMESPLELADDCLKKLGGVPNPHQEVWVGIARLNLADASCREDGVQAGTTGATSASPNTTSVTKPKREMTLANRIALVTNEPKFFDFLKEFDTLHFSLPEPDPFIPAETAAIFVRHYCGVNSRSEIKYDTPEAEKWKQLYTEYQDWLSSSIKGEER